jgi:hypothetical protein
MPDRTAWEYKVFVGWPDQFSEIPVGPDHGVLTELQSNEDTDLEIALTEIGGDGWELTSTLLGEPGGRRCVYFLFKRPRLPEIGEAYNT